MQSYLILNVNRVTMQWKRNIFRLYVYVIVYTEAATERCNNIHKMDEPILFNGHNQCSSGIIYRGFDRTNLS